MIPLDEINAWRTHAPWPSLVQVEQDLLITRAMVAIFSDPFLRSQVAMRGGTALHKVHLAPAARYSEDIDLVLVGDRSEGDVRKALRRVLQPLLGKPRNSVLDRVALGVRNTLRPSRIIRLDYEYTPTASGMPAAKLKVEVNCNEKAPVYDIVELDYLPIPGDGIAAAVKLRTYDINEMLGTKMRALYQRAQGRDLFDLWWALKRGAEAGPHSTDPDLIVAAFDNYMAREGSTVDADQYDAALTAKLKRPAFGHDMEDLLAGSDLVVDLETWAEAVRDTVIVAMRRRAVSEP